MTESENAMEERTPTPREGHPLPDAPQHFCPGCGRLCVYEVEHPTHACPRCHHTHSISAQDVADAYIHSPGGVHTGPMDEEKLACIIVAECHAYSWRNQVALGCYSMATGKQIYARRDNFGHITLLFNYRNQTPWEIPVDYELWEDLFLTAWKDGGKANTTLIWKQVVPAVPLEHDLTARLQAALEKRATVELETGRLLWQGYAFPKDALENAA